LDIKDIKNTAQVSFSCEKTLPVAIASWKVSRGRRTGSLRSNFQLPGF